MLVSTQKCCTILELKDFDVIKLNEAFASPGIAISRELGLAEGAEYITPNCEAIALGHPLCLSEAGISGDYGTGAFAAEGALCARDHVCRGRAGPWRWNGYNQRHGFL